MDVMVSSREEVRVNTVATWIQAMREVLGDAAPVVSDVRIGVFYTAAQLDSGAVGVAFTPRDVHDTVCCPQSAAAAPQAGRLAGRPAWALADEALTAAPLRRTVGIAVLNALSALAMERYGVPGGRVEVGVDALEAAGVQPTDRVTLVGAFVPFIKRLKHAVEALWVIDKHREALKTDELPCWRSPQEAPQVLAESSVVVITGSALVEGGIDMLLDAAAQARQVVLAGPTASPWPPPFFARGVSVLGGIRVTNGPRMLRCVSEGGSGYMFREAAEKICVWQER
jgi:uncharacterized protein (DUF4213/DUF364 family)